MVEAFSNLDAVETDSFLKDIYRKHQPAPTTFPGKMNGFPYVGAPLCKSPEIISNGQNEENEEAPTLAKLQFFLRYVRPMIWHVLGLQPDSLVRKHMWT